MSSLAPKIVDSFFNEAGKRKIMLLERRGVAAHPRWEVAVYVVRGLDFVFLSSGGYSNEALARRDFEIRRPKMRDSAGEEVPMQRGKRLVQEVMTEKLGPRKE